MTRLHDDEIEVDEELAARLVATLSPAYDGLRPRRFASSGSTNALFRLGEDLLVRIPRQPGGTATIEKEQRWLPYVAPHLPVALPEVIDVGEPAAGYAERWSVVRFLDGAPPVLPAPGEPPRHGLARDLAEVVSALRRLEVPPSALVAPDLRWYRGEPLAALDDDVRRHLVDCREIDGLELDLDAAEQAWNHALAVPAAHREGQARWYHGDLLAENLLVRGGRLTAVLDFGCLSVGNPAVDLAAAWELLDPAARTTFRAAVGVDDAEWRVARGWALALALMTFPYYWRTMPGRCADRLAQARAVLDDLDG